MAQKVECLKVGNELYQVGESVEIPMLFCDGRHVFQGRIVGFTEDTSKCPGDIYMTLDTSTLFNNNSVSLCVDRIKSIKRI